jgi:hypothetical protein
LKLASLEGSKAPYLEMKGSKKKAPSSVGGGWYGAVASAASSPSAEEARAKVRRRQDVTPHA